MPIDEIPNFEQVVPTFHPEQRDRHLGGLNVQPRAPAAIFRCSGIEDMQMTGKAQEMPTARRRLITLKEGLKRLRVGRTKAYELINAGKSSRTSRDIKR